MTTTVYGVPYPKLKTFGFKKKGNSQCNGLEKIQPNLD